MCFVDDLSHWRPGFCLRVIHVEFMVDKVFSLDGYQSTNVPYSSIIRGWAT
jgi:hypothetical protein